MKIYTKTGDKGETSLSGGKRVPKDSLRIEAYGTVDELNSILGMCCASNSSREVTVIIEVIQHELFSLGADLATPGDLSKKSVKQIDGKDVLRLEKHIDDIETKLEPLRNFILPGGSEGASLLHFARTVCRRAERRVVQLAREEKINEFTVVYLNRLSDLLFVPARWVNVLNASAEIKWNP